MATSIPGDARAFKQQILSLKKGVFATPPPNGENYLITDNDGVAKLFTSDGTRIPLGGGDVLALPQVFVSPTGTNSGLGTQASPFKTRSYAYTKVYASGGLITCATGTQWADGTEPAGPWGNALVAGQGMRLSQSTFSRPGWWRIASRVYFCGLPQSVVQFSQPLSIMLGGNTDLHDQGDGTSYRGDPAVWIDVADACLSLENYATDTVVCPYRVGYDYGRNADASIAQIAITSATRVGTSTTLTVTPWSTNIVSISRTTVAGVGRVRVVLGNTSGWHPPINRGFAWVTLSGSSDPNFVNGTYPIFSAIDWEENVIYYANNGADVSSGAIGTLASPGVGAGDRITMVNDIGSGQWGTCGQYLVTAADPGGTQITIYDPLGGHEGRGDVTVANLGHYCVELRSIAGYGNLNWYNIGVQMRTVPSPGFSGIGPGIDAALSDGFPFDIYGLYGFAHGGMDVIPIGPNFSHNKDENCMLLSDGGFVGSNVRVFNGRTSQGGARVYVHDSRTQEIRFQDWVQDTGTQALDPCVELIGSGTGGCKVHIERIINSDNMTPTAAVKLAPGLGSVVCVDVVGLDANGGQFQGFGNTLFDPTANARKKGQVSEYPINALARRGGLYQTPFVNKATSDLSNIGNWPVISGSPTMTGGQASWDGNATAFKNTGGIGQIQASCGSATAGDTILIGVWTFGAFGGGVGIVSISGHSTDGGGILAAPFPLVTDQWQFCYMAWQCISSGTIIFALTTPVNGLLADPICFPVTNSDEAYEILGTLQRVNPAASVGDLCGADGQTTRFRGRVLEMKAADQGSANTLTFGTGNSVKITDATNHLKFITTAGFQAVTRVYVFLPSGFTVENNAASPPGGTAPILLRAGANLVTAAAYLLELVYDGSNWVQPG